MVYAKYSALDDGFVFVCMGNVQYLFAYKLSDLVFFLKTKLI